MNIYIYGNKKFVNEINSILIKSDINNIRHLKSLNTLKDTIKKYPEEIFIIDDKRIIKNEFLYKINPFKSKYSVRKVFLDKYGIEDICFNSLSGLTKYILLKISIKSNNNQELKKDEVLDKEIKIEEEKDREILSIDDIYDIEMVDAMSDLNNQEKKKD